MSTRRYGSDTSKTRDVLLRAAEDLMRESGYAAVTSRRVASKAGLKPQLVHYYFPTMDQLFHDLFQQVAARALSALDGVLESEDPLKSLWEATSNSEGVVLSYELVGLANHRKELRAAIADQGNKLRAKKIGILHALFERARYKPPFTASFAAVLLDSLARNLALETELGVHAGHAEALEMVERYFGEISPVEAALDRRQAS